MSVRASKTRTITPSEFPECNFQFCDYIGCGEEGQECELGGFVHYRCRNHWPKDAKEGVRRRDNSARWNGDRRLGINNVATPAMIRRGRAYVPCYRIQEVVNTLPRYVGCEWCREAWQFYTAAVLWFSSLDNATRQRWASDAMTRERSCATTIGIHESLRSEITRWELYDVTQSGTYTGAVLGFLWASDNTLRDEAEVKSWCEVAGQLIGAKAKSKFTRGA